MMLLASIALYGGELVPYYLDEENGWALDMKELERSLQSARSKGKYSICPMYYMAIKLFKSTGKSGYPIHLK